MAQATRLSSLVGFLSGRVLPAIKWSPNMRQSLHQQKPNNFNFNQCSLLRRFSNNLSNGKSSKNNLTQSENLRYWETFEAELKQLTLIQRYKKMAKEFWYVGIPVVGITSALWLASFYLIAAR